MQPLPTIPWPAAIAIGIAVVALSAVLFGRSGVRLALACGAGLGVYLVPWLAPADDRFPRAVLALASMLPTLRIVDLVRDPREWSTPHRVWQFLMAFDAREATRVAPRLDLRALGWGVLQSTVFAAMVVLLGALARFAEQSWVMPVRLLAGVLAIYTLLGGASALTNALYRGIGVDFPPIQNAPILSRSLREFWGERWNRTVGRWLRRNCFAPLAHRGSPRLGVAAAFGASALVHVWLIFVPLGGTMALMMGSYFLVEGALLLAERPLRVHRWRPAFQHAWTVLGVVAPSPLFMLPMTQLLY